MNLKMMFSKRSKTIIIVASLSLFLLASCASVNKTLHIDTPTPPPVITYNSISGRVGTDGPVLVVKIDDTTQAHPQIGLDKADIVYIEQVEGGLTRLAAVFSSEIPTHIGPVRSARISDIDLLSQYGHVAFAYSGAQARMFPVIAAANLENLGAQRESTTIYTRDASRFAPVNLILQADLLMSKVKDAGVAIVGSKNMGWTFGAAPLGGKPILSVSVKWPSNTYSATWSPIESRWLLFHANSPDLAADGGQLGPTTLVIQMVSITPSQFHDKFGGVTPFSATVGAGTGYILRNGRAFAAKWTRPDATSGTTWTLPDGTPIPFAGGQIWVALTNSPPVFTPVPPPSPPSSASASASPTK
jgi:hypothetical protein